LRFNRSPTNRDRILIGVSSATPENRVMDDSWLTEFWLPWLSVLNEDSAEEIIDTVKIAKGKI
jgi:hypothetical protein